MVSVYKEKIDLRVPPLENMPKIAHELDVAKNKYAQNKGRLKHEQAARFMHGVCHYILGRKLISSISHPTPDDIIIARMKAKEIDYPPERVLLEYYRSTERKDLEYNGKILMSEEFDWPSETAKTGTAGAKMKSIEEQRKDALPIIEVTPEGITVITPKPDAGYEPPEINGESTDLLAKLGIPTEIMGIPTLWLGLGAFAVWYLFIRRK